MEQFVSNSVVKLTVDFEVDGAFVDPVDFEWTLLDADGNILTPPQTEVVTLPASEIVLEIPATHNQTTLKRDVRMVQITMKDANKTYTKNVFYILLGDLLKLTPLLDSFMTFPESILVRMKMAEGLGYYDELSDALKCIALENAFERLSQLKFVVGGNVITNIKDFSVDAFNALDPEFVLATKKAQLAESNILVENSPVRDKIRAGIISETIGESSMFFRQSGVPSSRFKGLSDDAYDYLGKFLYKDTVSSQIWRLDRA